MSVAQIAENWERNKKMDAIMKFISAFLFAWFVANMWKDYRKKNTTGVAYHGMMAIIIVMLLDRFI